MRARARIRVERRHGRDEVVDRSAEAPFAVRRCGDRIMLAATAAAPVGGDELDLDVVVGPGATAAIGSIGAMLVWPSPNPTSSSMLTTITVGAGAHLTFAPEPTITVAGSHHRATTRVDLEPGATCELTEEFSLGRSGEPAGTVETSFRVTRAGAPLFHHDETLGAAALSGATSVGVGGARHIATLVVVGPRVDRAATLVDGGGMAARLPLADDAYAILAVGVDRPIVRALIDRLRSTDEAATRYGKTIRPIDAHPH
ncbi:MAG: urease accessory protein UreD [Ilumatobacter sp.]|nr:urease accessory protein UreD [Ilumatobacter sp.]